MVFAHGCSRCSRVLDISTDRAPSFALGTISSRVGQDKEHPKQVDDRACDGEPEDLGDGAGGDAQDGVADEERSEGGAKGNAEMEHPGEAEEGPRTGCALGEVGGGRGLEGRPAAEETFEEG